MSYTDQRHRVDGDRAREQIEQERQLAPGPRRKLAESHEWLAPETAAALLACARHSLYDLHRALRRRSRSVRGAKGLQGIGSLYWRADVELLAAIHRGARISRTQAARVVELLKKRGIDALPAPPG